MTHADTLRGMAKAFMMAGSHERAGTCLAGANALDAVERVRAVVTKIDRLEDDTWAAWKRDADMYEQGRSDAYDHTHTLITEALEGDTE